MTACISSVYQTQVSLPKVESYYKRDNCLLRGNGVGFKASKFIFQAPLLFLCSRKRRVPRRERDTHGESSRNKHLYWITSLSLLQNQGAYINPVCIRRRTTRKIGWAKTIWFCSSSFVPSASFVRRGANFESRQLSKFLSLSLLDLRVLVKGLICKGLNRIIFDHESGSSGTDSRGTDWFE